VSIRATLGDLRGRRVLLVASGGGHLIQLSRLVPQLGVAPDSEWVTFDNPQARELLDGHTVHWVPYVASRDLAGVVRSMRLSRPWRRGAEGAVSTGAGLALAVLPEMAAAGRPAVYVESVSRVLSPSVTGRVLARTRRVGMYAQHAGGWGRPWRKGPSVLAAYRAVPGIPVTPRRVFVTLGSLTPHRFDRLVDAVLAYLGQHPGVEVSWQLGSTVRVDLPGRVERYLSQEDYRAELARADVVITHAGVGTAMAILDSGRMPVLLARHADELEHVDNHQFEVKAFLTERGLAADAGAVLADDAALAGVAGTRVELWETLRASPTDSVVV